jgi:hypothetical protein
MERRTVAKILLLALLMTLPLPTLGAGAWYCEGRPCGVSLLLCCCTSPDSFRDANCQEDAHFQTTPTAETEGMLACANGCQCEMVVTAESPCKAEGSVTFAVSALAVLLPLTPVSAPLISTTLMLPMEIRGPPVAPVSVLPLGLRAPPLA